MLDFDLEQDERTAVKTAMALAVSRYTDTVGKFVQNKADRLSIVQAQVERIARECAESARAEEDEVVRLFNAYLAEVAVSEPEKQNVTDTAEYNNSDEVPPSGDKAHPSAMDDIKGTEPVLADDPAEHLDMDADSTVKSDSFISHKEATSISCPYCGHLMTAVQDPANPANSGNQQRCPNCGATIQSTPGNVPQQPMPGGILPPGETGGSMYNNFLGKCARCEEEDKAEGSILCEACNEFVVTGKCQKCKHDGCDGNCADCETCDSSNEYMAAKEAQGEPGTLQDPDLPTDQNVQSPAEEDPTEQQLPPAVKDDSNGPAEVYTGVVQQTANQNAAMAWSTPGDDDIRQISQQYGLQPDQVRKDLRIVADFGDALAVNGDPNGDPNMDGYTELDGFGGRIPTTEEEVDVDNAIQHTADRTNLSPDDVYALVKESYGGDLGGQHYVSVSGEAHYYLPANLVGSQQQQAPQGTDDQVQQPLPADQEQQNAMSHLTSLAAFMEWEKAQLAHSDA